MDEQVGRIEAAPVGRTGVIEREPRTRQRGKLWLLLVAAVGIAALLIVHPWGGGKPLPAGRTGHEVPQAVREATATRGDMPVVLQGLGTVTPLATITVVTQINGQLMNVGFQEGQLVKKGDFLAQIDPRPYQVALEQAQGQLAHDQGLLQQAQSDLIRYQTLLRQDSISRQQAEDQRFLVLQYQGSIRTDQALIDNARLNLVYCRIVSPVDGRVGLRLVDPGNFVQTTGTNGIVVVTELQPISVIFPLPEDDLEPVMSRLREGAKLAVTAYDHSNTRLIATGTLETADNQIDTTTGMVKLRAIFPNTDDALFPNEFVNAHLVVDTLHAVTVVPTAAVQNGAPGSYVWLVKPDNTVAVRPVKVGPSDGERVAILSGLEPGERMVIDGTDRLREGAKVEVPSASANAPGADAPGAAPPGAAEQRRQHRHDSDAAH